MIFVVKRDRAYPWKDLYVRRVDEHICIVSMKTAARSLRGNMDNIVSFRDVAIKMWKIPNKGLALGLTDRSHFRNLLRGMSLLGR